jgi:dipeptidyl-peptidase-4
MGRPCDNVEGYKRSSVMNNVNNMTGSLMLVHGLIDENVHFRHTARLIDTLSSQGKFYDLVVFPGERHGARSSPNVQYLEKRLIEFLNKIK